MCIRDRCVSAIRSDLKNDEYSDYMVMLEEDLYLAVPTHSPYGDKDSIRLADTKNAGYICLAGSRPIRQICNSYSVSYTHLDVYKRQDMGYEPDTFAEIV